MDPNGYEDDISTTLLAFRCGICGKPLRDPESLERGWGPVCDEKRMGGSGSDAVLQGLENFDEKELESAILSAPDIEPEGWLRYIKKIKSFEKGDELPDGTVAEDKSRVLIGTKPFNPGSFSQYLAKKSGGSAANPNAPWRHDPEARRQLVSDAIWYASRAATFGYPGYVVSATKVDPKWLVVKSAQEIARAAGMPAAAAAMVNFYGGKIVAVVKETMKATQANGSQAVVFETVDPGHVAYRDPVGDGVIRVHCPYNPEWNRIAGDNKILFFTFKKSKPYFWRYFREPDLRKVVNLVSGVFGDKLSITRRMPTDDEKRRRSEEIRGKVIVVDSSTGETRYLDKAIANKICRTRGRYRILK